MQDGILFDNILVAKDEKAAASIRDTTWKPKFDAEKEKQKAEEAATGTDGLAGFQVMRRAVFAFICCFY
jgi:calnexin